MRVLILMLGLSYCFVNAPLSGQSSYFPPINGNEWETIDPSSLGWCQDNIDSLYSFLEGENTKAFIVLKDGRIVLEKYFGTFVQDSLWYWASAGKSLTACLVGIAQQEGHLSIMDKTSDYLGEGWTDCMPDQEEKITILNQLTMTSGLDDGVEDNHCTLDTCLVYKADAGTRWAYHNGPYTLLDGVIEIATNQSLNTYFFQKIRPVTGINGAFVQLGYNNVFFSTARSMARFGLWMLHRGNWNGTQLMTDTAYFNHMVNTSQSLNKSYGYLWWLNGKSSYMLPGLQFVLPGSLMPSAPDDMTMALGKNGQFVNVVPSQDLVLIRMGNAPDGSEVPVTLNIEIWDYMNQLECATKTSDPHDSKIPKLYPNPGRDHLNVSFPDHSYTIQLFNSHGVNVMQPVSGHETTVFPLSLPPGLYFVRVMTDSGHSFIERLIVTP
jgi:CubicO group peptidase (beta-lactamase class C family)